MDCRTTLLLTLGLTLGGAGCAPTSQSIQPADLPAAATPAPPPPPAPAVPETPPLGKRPPLPGTCVALAACRERMAEKAGLAPAVKQSLYDQAHDGYLQAIKLDPNHLPAYFGLARIYDLQNQPHKALATYHQALERKPRDASLWQEVGMCHCRARQWELAIRSLARALELEPENRRLTQTLGFCQARAGRIDDSIETLAKVMAPADVQYHVARMMQHLQRDAECRQHLHEALRLDANHAAARAMLDALDAGTPLAAGSQHSAVQIGFAE